MNKFKEFLQEAVDAEYYTAGKPAKGFFEGTVKEVNDFINKFTPTNTSIKNERSYGNGSDFEKNYVLKHTSEYEADAKAKVYLYIYNKGHKLLTYLVKTKDITKETYDRFDLGKLKVSRKDLEKYI